MTRKYFGTDGVRGQVGQAPITPEFVMRLGYSAGKVLVEDPSARGHLKTGERPAVLIGRTRESPGYMLEASLEAGFAAAGGSMSAWSAPFRRRPSTYLTRARCVCRPESSSRLTHNPFYDNGIKFFRRTEPSWKTRWKPRLKPGIESPLVCGLGGSGACATDRRCGRGVISRLQSSFPNDLDLRRLKIVVDCAHGAAYNIAPHVFTSWGPVIAIGANPTVRTSTRTWARHRPEP
ncbi:hypothetical protein [Propionivibrio sp.]|uniref:hypothetical protein n=1 Tax=Propionivibrio sp. TaxID=2212460 RepID=UPI0025CCAA3D|nr:hypothetical protein [Propionivibrio sp.]